MVSDEREVNRSHSNDRAYFSILLLFDLTMESSNVLIRPKLYSTSWFHSFGSMPLNLQETHFSSAPNSENVMS